MRAAIFDIDGTLIESLAVDNSLYVDAVRHVLGDVQIHDGWEKYARVTDTGILSQICEENARPFSSAVSAAVMGDFVARLSSHFATHGPFREFPGALRYLTSLRQRPDMRVAYATGGWRASAELKLASAGFPLHGIPLASSDDYQDRTQIMLHALAQLEGPFDSVTYFGDGVWDRQATAELGWEFVPVGAKLGGTLDFANC